MNDFLHNLRGGGKRFDRGRKQYENPQYRQGDRHHRDRRNGPPRRTSDAELPALKKALEDIAENQKRLADFSERRAAAEERKAQALEAMAVCLQAFIAKDPDAAGEIARLKGELAATVSVEPAPELESASEADPMASYVAEQSGTTIRSEEIESERSWDELTETLATAVEAKVSPALEPLRNEPADGPDAQNTEPDDEQWGETGATDRKVILRKKRIEAEAIVDEPAPHPAVGTVQKMTEKDRKKVIRTIIGKRKKGMSYEKIAQFLEEKDIQTFSGKGQWRGQTVHRIYRQNVD